MSLLVTDCKGVELADLLIQHVLKLLLEAEASAASNEVERKFLVAELPSGLEQYPSKEIEQLYVSITPEVRARRSNDDYFITAKSGKGLSRKEVELAISQEEYEALCLKVLGNVISKTRYLLAIGDGLVVKQDTAELDVFKDALTGLYLVEVEFKSEEDAERFVPLHWFGAEVTYDDAYKNRNLALNGIN